MRDEIDLSLLPPPDVVETIDYEAILAARVARLKAEFAAAGIQSDWDETQESDTIVKLAQESAYREMILRGRVNDAARAVLLAYATGTNLVQIGALYGVAKLDGEKDDRYRRRVQMALEGFTTAGPRKAYIFHALSADVRVKDVSVTSPEPGLVLITVLSDMDSGWAPPDLLDVVTAALNDEEVRPLCDTVEVQSAAILLYEIVAELTLFDGPDHATVLAAASAAAAIYAQSCHVLGGLVAQSGIDAALHQSGVKKAVLASPLAEIATDKLTAPFCTGISVEKADG